jgi:hypothetical protein
MFKYPIYVPEYKNNSLGKNNLNDKNLESFKEIVRYSIYVFIYEKNLFEWSNSFCVSQII